MDNNKEDEQLIPSITIKISLYNRLLSIVKRAADNSCCQCCDVCLACDAVLLLDDLKEFEKIGEQAVCGFISEPD